MHHPLPADAFEVLVSGALAALPASFRERIQNVAIVIASEPTTKQKRELRLHRGHTLFGLYEGVPNTARGGVTPLYPDVITIFQGPLEREARDAEELKSLVRDTVWHEIAHHFGMSEPRVRRAERWRRTKTR